MHQQSKLNKKATGELRYAHRSNIFLLCISSLLLAERFEMSAHQKIKQMKPVEIILSLLLFFLFANTGLTFSQTSLFSYGKYTDGKGDTLSYRQLYPGL